MNHCRKLNNLSEQFLYHQVNCSTCVVGLCIFLRVLCLLAITVNDLLACEIYSVTRPTPCVLALSTRNLGFNRIITGVTYLSYEYYWDWMSNLYMCMYWLHSSYLYAWGYALWFFVHGCFWLWPGGDFSWAAFRLLDYTFGYFVVSIFTTISKWICANCMFTIDHKMILINTRMTYADSEENLH